VAVGEEVEESDLPVRTTYMIARLSRLVQRELEQRLVDFELSVPEFTTLSVLARRPGLSNAQLARRAYITPQSMQDVLHSLEVRGLVKRSADPRNKRVLQARLTVHGRRLTLRADAVAGDVEQLMMDGVTARRSEEFSRTMRHCISVLGGGLDRT
jgi:DNA-binding MarR family transcriptional regulator